MDNPRKWKSKRLAVVAAILAASAAFNIKLFTEQREHALAEKKEAAEIMIVIQEADSKLQGAILNIQNGGEAADSLYVFGEVRARLSEAAGGLKSMRIGTIQDTDRSFEIDTMYRITHEFDTYLRDEVLAEWQAGDAMLDASREQTLTELRSLKLDLAALAGLAQDPSSGGSYDIGELSGQWEEQISKRIKEEPDTDFHKRLAERYGL
ncbi:hypothetical protein [Saccharibacillus deserti]|uniref:hypothetical protein n=1 Tax=Saccharibacillus deserti TaxID=1634444 RepID=UPI00155210D0|nr:hypothetical protein [Saccharibacillus deserti]